MSRKVRRITIPELEDAPESVSQKWTREEEIVLATYYGKKSPASIAGYLKRTPMAIKHHAAIVGISYETTEEEREEILRKLQQEEDPE